MIFKATHRTTHHPISATSQEAFDAAILDHEEYIVSAYWLGKA